MTTQPQTTINPNNAFLKSLLLVSLLGILGISLYNFLTKSEPMYIQLAIVFGLSISLINSFKTLERHKYLKLSINVVLAILALTTLVLAILIG